MTARDEMSRISRRDFLRGVGAGAGLAAVGPLLAAPLFGQEPGRKPNIIFIITDDQSRDEFNFLPEGKGRNLSPNIDRLAEEGTVLLGQHCPSPVCGPSRFSCLTGRYAGRTRVPWMVARDRREGQSIVTNGTAIMPEDENLPELLKQAGYVTGAVGKNHVIRVPDWKRVPSAADARDPEVVKELKANAERIRKAFKQNGFDSAESMYHNNPVGNGPRELAVHNMDWIAKGAVDFIDRNKDRPFFLYVATTLTHGPRARKSSWGADPLATPEGYLTKSLDVLPERATLAERVRNAGLRNRENVLWLDDGVGAITNRLEEHGIDDNTIIFIFDDHGVGAKGSVYESGTRSPAFVWKKGGFKCGKSSDALISNIDFAPTILELAGARAPARLFDGKSFVGVLEGRTQKVHDSLYFEVGYTRGVLKDNWKYLALRYSDYANNLSLEERKRLLEKQNRFLRSWRRKPHNTDPKAPFSHYSLVPGGGDTEFSTIARYPAYFDADQLYNLTEDPNEQTNLAGDARYADKLAGMKAELTKYLMTLPGPFAEFKKDR